MSGRPKVEQGDEKRVHRSVIRWTATEKARIAEAQKKLGLIHEVDVIRMFVLDGVNQVLPSEDDGMAK